MIQTRHKIDLSNVTIPGQDKADKFYEACFDPTGKKIDYEKLYLSAITQIIDEFCVRENGKLVDTRMNDDYVNRQEALAITLLLTADLAVERNTYKLPKLLQCLGKKYDLFKSKFIEKAIEGYPTHGFDREQAALYHLSVCFGEQAKDLPALEEYLYQTYKYCIPSEFIEIIDKLVELYSKETLTKEESNELVLNLHMTFLPIMSAIIASGNALRLPFDKPDVDYNQAIGYMTFVLLYKAKQAGVMIPIISLDAENCADLCGLTESHFMTSQINKRLDYVHTILMGPYNEGHSETTTQPFEVIPGDTRFKLDYYVDIRERDLSKETLSKFEMKLDDLLNPYIKKHIVKRKTAAAELLGTTEDKLAETLISNILNLPYGEELYLRNVAVIYGADAKWLQEDYTELGNSAREELAERLDRIINGYYLCQLAESTRGLTKDEITRRNVIAVLRADEIEKDVRLFSNTGWSILMGMELAKQKAAYYEEFIEICRIDLKADKLDMDFNQTIKKLQSTIDDKNKEINRLNQILEKKNNKERSHTTKVFHETSEAKKIKELEKKIAEQSKAIQEQDSLINKLMYQEEKKSEKTIDPEIFKGKKFIFAGTDLSTHSPDLLEVFPGSVIIDTEREFDPNLKADAVIFFIKYISHSDYYSIKSKNRNPKVIYFNAKNIEQLKACIAEQLM